MTGMFSSLGGSRSSRNDASSAGTPHVHTCPIRLRAVWGPERQETAPTPYPLLAWQCKRDAARSPGVFAQNAKVRGGSGPALPLLACLPDLSPSEHQVRSAAACTQLQQRPHHVHDVPAVSRTGTLDQRRAILAASASPHPTGLPSQASDGLWHIDDRCDRRDARTVAGLLRTRDAVADGRGDDATDPADRGPGALQPRSYPGDRSRWSGSADGTGTVRRFRLPALPATGRPHPTQPSDATGYPCA